jgi:antitoxin VapB
MPLNVKNAEVERLAAEVARMARESKTEAIRRALEDRKTRLALRRGSDNRAKRIKNYFEREVWPLIPAKCRSKRMSKQEREAILGIASKAIRSPR